MRILNKYGLRLQPSLTPVSWGINSITSSLFHFCKIQWPHTHFLYHLLCFGFGLYSTFWSIMPSWV
jgi:hypothetical protein